jgi:uncharacterized membrane protein HdeD (DUF308 family)
LTEAAKLRYDGVVAGLVLAHRTVRDLCEKREAAMEQEGCAFAFVAGICAGILNLLCGLNALGNVLFALEYVVVPLGLIMAAAGLVAITVLNLAGGCICRKRRVAGGRIMLISAFLLLIIGAACVYIPARMPEVFLTFGSEFAEGVQRAVLGAGLLMLFAELLSIAAGVVSLAAKPKR